MITKLAMSDDPPYEMNGSVTPVSGITRITPPTITKVCTPMIVVSPAANSFENGRSAWMAMRNPLPTSSRNSMHTATVPSRPSSSPMAESTKSVDAFGIFCGLPEPEPGAGEAAAPNANSDCTSWKPVVCDTDHGSTHEPTRSCTWPKSWYATNAPARNMPSATTRYDDRSVAM